MSLKTIVNHFLGNKYLAFFISIIIFVLCTMPSKQLPVGQNFNDKIAHFLAFGAWAFCWQAAFGKYTQTIIIGFVYGILIEFWQGILPEEFHRSFDWYDALADGIGVIIGVVFWKVKELLKL